MAELYWEAPRDREHAWEIALRNEGLVRKLVFDFVNRLQVGSRSAFNRPEIVDFVMPAAWEAALEAVEGFDPKRGFKFSTYAFIVIRNAVNSSYRALLAQKGGAKHHSHGKREVAAGRAKPRIPWTGSFEEMVTVNSETSDGAVLERLGMVEPDFTDELVQKLDAQVRLERLMLIWDDVLTGLQSKVMRMRFLEGMSGPEVGRALGISRQRVDQIVKDSRAKLTVALEGVSA